MPYCPMPSSDPASSGGTECNIRWNKRSYRRNLAFLGTALLGYIALIVFGGNA